MVSSLKSLLAEIKNCTLCAAHLPHGCRPVLQVNQKAKILIAGQAPGTKVHQSGIPFNDASGNRLREWMGVSSDVFYDANKVAILPMGFCYPGTGKSGDLPPRPECEAAWRKQLLDYLPNIKMTLVLGKYAQDYHFQQGTVSVTALVKSWQCYWPDLVPLPHPSPRNNRWLISNPWFESEVLPQLKSKISKVLAA